MITLDPHQAHAAARLAELGRDLSRRRRRTPVRGVYLHGPVGRGKTMLLDAFLDGSPAPRVRRIHMHELLTELHTATHRHGSFAAAVDALTAGIDLLGVDEFQVHDVGDARLLEPVLDRLIARRVPLVITSNHPPAQLLPNPLFRHAFEHGRTLLAEHLDIVEVAGPIDYRTRRHSGGSGFGPTGFSPTGFGTAGFGTGRYLVASDAPAERTVPVRVGARTIQADETSGNRIVVDFARLCGTPTGAADYLRLAAAFPEWEIRGVPVLRDTGLDAAQRFCTLIDVLYDAGRHVTVLAAAEPDELFREVTALPGRARALSRLRTLPAPDA